MFHLDITTDDGIRIIATEHMIPVPKERLAKARSHGFNPKLFSHDGTMDVLHIGAGDAHCLNMSLEMLGEVIRVGLTGIIDQNDLVDEYMELMKEHIDCCFLQGPWKAI